MTMNEMNVQERKQKDSWEEYFPRDNENSLIQSVIEMEKNSEWIHGITAREIRLEAIDDRPLFLQTQVQQYHLDNLSLVVLLCMLRRKVLFSLIASGIRLWWQYTTSGADCQGRSKTAPRTGQSLKSLKSLNF